jgi:putative ABC transport system permease protein
MFDRDKWQEVFHVLEKNKLRTFLTAFGVFWGIFMLIVLLGSGNGLKNGVVGDFGGHATNSMFIWTQNTSMAYMGFKRGRSFNFHNSDVEYLKSNIPEIAILSPRAQMGGHNGSNNVVRGLKTEAFNVYGDFPEYILIEPVRIIKGRFLNQNDLREKRKVCVIGMEVFNSLFLEGEEPIGDYIEINGVNFKVIGLYESKQSGRQGEESEKSVFIPLTTFQRAFNWGDIVAWFSITSIENIPVSVVEEKVLSILKQRYKVHPDDPRAFGYFNLEKEFIKMNGLFTGISGLSWFVGVLTLIAGVIGVSNIMLIVVKERTQEIGVRRALGATPSNIMSQIVIESVFLTSIAGIVGVLSGTWILVLVDTLMGDADTGSFKHPEINLYTILIALSVLIISGALAGLIPAQRAVKIRPIEALRDE